MLTACVHLPLVPNPSSTAAVIDVDAEEQQQQQREAKRRQRRVVDAGPVVIGPALAFDTTGTVFASCFVCFVLLALLCS